MLKNLRGIIVSAFQRGERQVDIVRRFKNDGLNPMDYAIWGILEARVNATAHRTLDSLKRAVQREWDKHSMQLIRAAVGSWRRRLQACVDARGGRFE